MKHYCNEGFELCNCDPPCRGRCPICYRHMHPRIDKTRMPAAVAAQGEAGGEAGQGWPMSAYDQLGETVAMPALSCTECGHPIGSPVGYDPQKKQAIYRCGRCGQEHRGPGTHIDPFVRFGLEEALCAPCPLNTSGNPIGAVDRVGDYRRVWRKDGPIKVSPRVCAELCRSWTRSDGMEMTGCRIDGTAREVPSWQSAIVVMARAEHEARKAAERRERAKREEP